MNLLAERRYLQAQITELEQMLGDFGDDPISAPSITSKKNELAALLQALPNQTTLPQTTLYFAGGPVRGSAGIDVSFAATMLNEFQELTKAQYLFVKHGSLSNFGRMPVAPEAKLQLTALPRGSFGLELSHAGGSDLVATQQVSEVLHQLSGLIRSAADSDTAFEATLPTVPPRAVPHLKTFLATMGSAGATVRIVTGDEEFSLNDNQVAQAVERLNATTTEESDVELVGHFRGATLDSWRFDFKTDDGESISGRLGADLEERTVTDMLPLTNQRVRARLKKSTVSTRRGEVRASYELLGIELNPQIALGN